MRVSFSQQNINFHAIPISQWRCKTMNNKIKNITIASFEAKENGISGVIATTDEETRRLFADNLGALMGKMQKGAADAEPVEVTVTRVDDLSMWQFEKNTLSETGEATPVQTKRLYHIAESFIQTVSDLMN